MTAPTGFYNPHPSEIFLGCELFLINGDDEPKSFFFDITTDMTKFLLDFDCKKVFMKKFDPAEIVELGLTKMPGPIHKLGQQYFNSESRVTMHYREQGSLLHIMIDPAPANAALDVTRRALIYRGKVRNSGHFDQILKDLNLIES